MAVLSALALLLAAPALASAAEIVVNTTADGADGECVLDCTLREAIGVASPTDSVTVPAGTYQLQTPGELVLQGDNVNGVGARSTIIRGNGTARVMTANSGPSNQPSVVSSVTITNGGGTGQTFSGSGGGVYVGGTLNLVNSHVTNNTAAFDGGGIALGVGDTLTLVGSTVAGNTATGSGSRGGAIFAAAETDVDVFNSTISANSLTTTNPDGAGGGGISVTGYTLELHNATVSNNTAPTGSGGGVSLSTVDPPLLTNSILADNTGGACGGIAVASASHHNLVTDGTCALAGPGNLQGVSAQLGALADNGGPTDTLALAPTSPAINAGSDCQATDQRGVARPQLGACDIGAYEYRAPVLTVTTTVVNDHGFNDVASDFTVHVRSGGADVAGSPAPGSAGTGYTLVPGTYVVSADPRRQYAYTYGGSCNPDGSVALGEGSVATCTVAANDPSPTPGQEVNALPASGTVRVKLAGKGWRRLKEGEQLPKGTSVDTLKGRVTLLAAGGQRMTFYEGIFKITAQSKGAKPLTTLTLTEPLACAPRKGKQAGAAAAKKKKRRLWGDGTGRFQTKGKHSAATVVGTKWLVEDTCTTTLTRVVRGKVRVRDLVKKKTVTLKKGQRYTARAKGR